MMRDTETWIIETGAAVVQKLNDEGSSSLSSLEWAAYWLWQIDYSVCNSGCLGSMDDMESTAIQDLRSLALQAGFQKLATWLKSAGDEILFCEAYSEKVDDATAELRAAYNGV